jgi:hypothetical protein
MTAHSKVAERRSRNPSHVSVVLDLKFSEYPIPLRVAAAFGTETTRTSRVGLKRRQRSRDGERAWARSPVRLQLTHRLPPELKFPETFPAAIFAIHGAGDGSVEESAVDVACLRPHELVDRSWRQQG